MKLATITATFPELRGGHAYKTGRGKGSSAEIAVARACRDLFDKIEHRRVTVFKATIVIQEIAGHTQEQHERQEVAA